MNLNKKLIFIIFILLHLQGCFSSIPEQPPCFSDGNEPVSSSERAGALTIAKCCLTEQDCIDRFSEALNEEKIQSTPAIIGRFSYCEPLPEVSSSFDDLSDEYGTCVLNVNQNNAECRVGRDCGEGERCCPAYGDDCTDKFGPENESCVLCVEGECDVQ